MCRLMAYCGPQILVADVVLWPARSIIKQSYDARERRNDSSLPFHLGYGNLNGDGFGIGWFAPESSSRQDPTPCTFTSVTPAWNNENLNRLATKLESGLIFAHVRAAYPGMPVSEQNCHPFQWGRYLFMHNGVVAGFMAIRRALLAQLGDAAYNAVQSFHSDSAVSFALFLNHLPDLNSPQPPEVMLRALQATITTITSIQAEAGITDVSLLNYVVSDGTTLIATRFVSADGDAPASLYYAEGWAYQRSSDQGEVSRKLSTAAAALNAGGGEQGAAGARSKSVTGEGDYSLTYSEMGTRVCLVASEPVTGAAGDWAEVPRNTALVVSREKTGVLNVLQAPITACGAHPRHEEVARCLEAVGRLSGVTGVAQMPRASSSHAPHALSALARQDSGGLPADSADTGAWPRCASALGGPALSQGGVPAPESAAAGQEEEHWLTGHGGTVMTLLTHDGLLFTGSTDATIRVWSLQDFKCLHVLRGHTDPIRQLAVAGGRLFSVGARRVRMWCLQTYTCLGVMQACDISGAAKAMAVSSAGSVYIGGQDCRVKMFASPEGSSVAGATPVSGGALGAVSQPDGLAAAPPCGAARRGGLGTASPPTAVSDPDNGHCGSVTALALCGAYLCSASTDSTVRVWDALTLAFVRVLRGHRGSVLTLHSCGGLLLSGGRDHLIRVWDSDTLVCRRTLSGHSDDVLSITSVIAPGWSADLGELGSPGGSLSVEAMGASPGSPRSVNSPLIFASASADGTVRLWSAKCYSCLRVLGGRPALGRPPPPIMCCAATASCAAAAMPDGVVRLFGTEDVVAASLVERGRGQHEGCGHEEGGTAAKRLRLDPSAVAAAESGALKRMESVAELSLPPMPRARLEKEFERALRSFVRIRTVSADPALHEECFRGAKFLLRLLEGLGAEVKLSQPVEDKNPVVIARLGQDPAKPTVTFYGHYDVQPALEPEWGSDPWDVAAVDGYLVARGVSDNKGPVLAFVYAVRELLEECRGGGGCLPVNIAFLIEGEEENGSIGFREAVQSNLRWFQGTELVIISNTLWVGERVPCLTYGMRGMISLSIEVKGPTRDLHSGNEGGVFAEPLVDLSKVLASLVDSRANIMVPGFYSGVQPDMLAAALGRLAAHADEFSMGGYRAALGVPDLTTGRSERDLLNARWCQPSLSVVDVRVGTAAEEGHRHQHYRFGPTRFSVIPKAAVGKVSVRYVPNQDAGELVDRLTTHVRHEFAKLRSGNEISVKVHSIGDWWEADPESVLMRQAEAAVEAEWGCRPLLVREGGTMPVASALEKLLGAPALLLPMGQSSDNCHLANERIRMVNLLRGKNVVKHLLAGMGRPPAERGGAAA